MKLSYMLVLAAAIALLSSSPVRAADAGVMGFQSWKNSRIEEARAGLERIQLELQIEKAPPVERSPGDKAASVSPGATKEAAAKGAATRGAGLMTRDEPIRPYKQGRPDQRLEQARLNVEIAQELSVHDYFVLYLNQFKGREAFLEAAKQLTPEETAELMIAYHKELSGSDVEDAKLPSFGNASKPAPLNPSGAPAQKTTVP